MDKPRKAVVFVEQYAFLRWLDGLVGQVVRSGDREVSLRPAMFDYIVSRIPMVLRFTRNDGTLNVLWRGVVIRG